MTKLTRTPRKPRITIFYDTEAKVYGAYSPDLEGLHCEANTIHELKEAVEDCIGILKDVKIG